MFAILAAALASADLNLELICQAQWPDTEFTQSFAPKRDADGSWRPEVTRSSRDVIRTGVVHVSLHGDGGQLDLGRQGTRPLTNVVADERSILAEYKAGRDTRLVQINRISGELRLLDRSTPILQGMCSAEASQPKF